MYMSEITLLLVLLNTFLALWSIRVLSMAIQSGISQLDESMARAIQSVLEGDFAGSIEPPNPIQAAIAQMLTQRIQNAPVDLARDSAGKFSQEKVS